MMKHIVILKFHKGSPEDKQQECIDAFLGLSQSIEEVIAFDQGSNVSTEGLSKGFTHSAVMTFSDSDARDRYLIHPEHIKFVAMLKPLLDDVLVFDYEY